MVSSSIFSMGILQGLQGPSAARRISLRKQRRTLGEPSVGRFFFRLFQKGYGSCSSENPMVENDDPIVDMCCLMAIICQIDIQMFFWGMYRGSISGRTRYEALRASGILEVSRCYPRFRQEKPGLGSWNPHLKKYKDWVWKNTCWLVVWNIFYFPQ